MSRQQRSSTFDTAVKAFVDADLVQDELLAVCDQLMAPSAEDGKQLFAADFESRLSALEAVVPHVCLSSSTVLAFHERALSSKDSVERVLSVSVDHPKLAPLLLSLMKSVVEAIPPESSVSLRRRTVEAALETRPANAIRETDAFLPRRWDLISAVITTEDHDLSKSVLAAAFDDLSNSTSDNKRFCDAIIYTALPRLASGVNLRSLEEILAQDVNRNFGSALSVWVLRGLASLLESVPSERKLCLWGCRALRNLVRDGLVSEVKECRKLSEFILSAVAPPDWDQYSGFIVALAETQLHIVSPTVTNVRKYVESGTAVKFAIETAGDISWLFVLLERLWLHENAWVVSQGVLTTCAMPELPPDWDAENNLAFLQKTFLAAVNDGRIYYVPETGGFVQFRQSMERFFKTWIGKSGDRLARACELILSKNLGPVPLFLLSWAFGCVHEELNGSSAKGTSTSLSEAVASKVLAVLPERTSGFPSEIRTAILRIWVEKVLSLCQGFNIFGCCSLIVRCLSKSDKNVHTMLPRRVEVLLSAVVNKKLKTEDLESEVERILKSCSASLTNGQKMLDDNDAEILSLLLRVIVESKKEFKYLEYFDKLFDVEQESTCRLMEAVDYDQLLKIVSQSPRFDQVAFLRKVKTYRFRLFVEGKATTTFPLWQDLKLRQTSLESIKELLESLRTADGKLNWKLHFIAAMQSVSFRHERFEDKADEKLEGIESLYFINHVSYLSNFHWLPPQVYLHRLLKKAVNLIPVGDFESISFALESIIEYLESDSLTCDREQDIKDAALFEMRILWDRVLVMRGHAYFWTLLKTTTRVVFHPFFLKSSITNPWLDALMEKMWESCLRGSEIVMQLMTLVSAWILKQMKELKGISFAEIPFGRFFFVSLALFGPLRRRDQRLLDQLIFSVSRSDWMAEGVKLEDGVPSDASVRLQILDILGRMDPTNFRDVAFAKAVASELISTCWERTQKGESGAPLRNFLGSRQHREQARILQTLLCLSAFLSEDEQDEEAVKTGLDWAKTVLLGDGLHHSILYLVEWLAVELIRKQPQLLIDFAFTLLDGAGNRGGPAASLMRIMVFGMRAEPGILAGDPVARPVLVQRVISLCMSHNFATRAHAQWAAGEMLEMSKRDNGFSQRDAVLLKLAVDAASDCATLDEAVKKRSSGELLIQHFNPALHFSIETIFLDFPRVTGLPEDEWFPRDWLKTALGEASLLQNFLPLKAKSDLMAKFEPKPQPEGPALVFSMHEEVGAAGDSAKKENLQVKHISSRYCGPSFAQLTESGAPDPAIGIRLRGPQTGLIVCATLIDKAPNLGGLCRTCEVLGVDEYVVRSMKLVENHDFKSVSVSAEKWMTIREVTEPNLKPYLLSMRSLGYTVVALEQTAESVSINEFQFPEKTLLVLGHEKEGIPGPLLNMVDVNVIIPQSGIVRSLNVHVAASVGIWEYVRARSDRQS